MIESVETLRRTYSDESVHYRIRKVIENNHRKREMLNKRPPPIQDEVTLVINEPITVVSEEMELA
jgi:hypothetical protein